MLAEVLDGVEEGEGRGHVVRQFGVGAHVRLAVRRPVDFAGVVDECQDLGAEVVEECQQIAGALAGGTELGVSVAVREGRGDGGADPSGCCAGRG
jgi:hypothetical protein